MDYIQYKGGLFRVPLLTRWTVIVTGPKFIEELRKAPDEQLSFEDAIDEVCLKEVAENFYHKM